MCQAPFAVPPLHPRDASAAAGGNGAAAALGAKALRGLGGIFCIGVLTFGLSGGRFLVKGCWTG